MIAVSPYLLQGNWSYSTVTQLLEKTGGKSIQGYLSQKNIPLLRTHFTYTHFVNMLSCEINLFTVYKLEGIAFNQKKKKTLVLQLV